MVYSLKTRSDYHNGMQLHVQRCPLDTSYSSCLQVLLSISSEQRRTWKSLAASLHQKMKSDHTEVTTTTAKTLG